MPGFDINVKAKFKLESNVGALIGRVFAIWLRSFLARCVREIKKEIATPYPPASKPGEPPHRRSGTLMGSVAYQVREKDLVGAVTVSAPYAGYLVKGTKRMKARPFGLKTVKRVAGLARSLVTISRRIGS